MMVQTPAESNAAVQQAVDRIATRFHPDKIILFGSRARGQGGPNSDADLLVVEKYRNVAGTIIHEAVREGKVLCE